MKPAPDAGNTFLGHYTLANPMVCWLLANAPEVLAETPTEVREPAKPPLCPRDNWTMRLRPPTEERHSALGQWVCYRHKAPVRQQIQPGYEPAPDYDVLAHVGDELDWVWSDAWGCHVVKVVRI